MTLEIVLLVILVLIPLIHLVWAIYDPDGMKTAASIQADKDMAQLWKYFK